MRLWESKSEKETCVERERVVIIRKPASRRRRKMVCRNSSSPSSPLRIQILLVLSLLFSPIVLAKSRRPITDIETRQKKAQCYADIESGLWGWQCKSSMIAKENCVLKCLSPTCYEIVYESDPLEEGEKDLVRGQEFKYCMHKLSLGESLEGIKGSFNY